MKYFTTIIPKSNNCCLYVLKLYAGLFINTADLVKKNMKSYIFSDKIKHARTIKRQGGELSFSKGTFVDNQYWFLSGTVCGCGDQAIFNVSIAI